MVTANFVYDPGVYFFPPHAWRRVSFAAREFLNLLSWELPQHPPMRVSSCDCSDHRAHIFVLCGSDFPKLQETCNQPYAHCELPNDIRQHTGGLGPPCVALQTLLAAINKRSRVEVMRQYSAEHGSAQQFDSCALWSSFYDLR